MSVLLKTFLLISSLPLVILMIIGLLHSLYQALWPCPFHTIVLQSHALFLHHMHICLVPSFLEGL